VEEKLALGWSPEQISIRLPIEYQNDTRMRISYEAIYQHVYHRVRRGGNGKVRDGYTDLRPLLARRHTRRQTKGSRAVQKIERNDKLPSIEQRPKIVEKRIELGHWEDDTMVSRQSATRLKTINELVSGITLIGKMSDGSITESNRVVIDRLKVLPTDTHKTLTRDRGSENFGWNEIQDELNLTCWFAHPYCSHERGSNENGNGLIRRFFPKKTDFAIITDDEIARVEYLLNTRPRKRLGGKTPYEVFYELTGVALDC
jgi:IS30 family transposase